MLLIPVPNRFLYLLREVAYCGASPSADLYKKRGTCHAADALERRWNEAIARVAEAEEAYRPATTAAPGDPFAGAGRAAHRQRAARVSVADVEVALWEIGGAGARTQCANGCTCNVKRRPRHVPASAS